jgi:cell division septation protein DedD
VPAPTPTPTGPSPQSTSGRTEALPAAAGRLHDASYSVLVASFRQESEAALLTRQLGELGFHVRTSRVESSGRGVWHQVFVGPYSDIGEARRDEARVREIPGYRDAQLITK